jgi:hypothetical protein
MIQHPEADVPLTLKASSVSDPTDRQRQEREVVGAHRSNREALLIRSDPRRARA